MKLCLFHVFLKLFIVVLLSDVWLLATIRHSKDNLEPFYLFSLVNLFMWLMLLSGFSPHVCGVRFQQLLCVLREINRCVISGWFNHCFALYKNVFLSNVPSISGDVPSNKTIWIMINQFYQKKTKPRAKYKSDVEIGRCVINRSGVNQGRKWQTSPKENRTWNNHSKNLEIMTWRWHVKHYNVNFQLTI